MHKLIVLLALFLLGAGPVVPQPREGTFEAKEPPISRQQAVSVVTKVSRLINDIKSDDNEDAKLAYEMQDALEVVRKVLTFDEAQIKGFRELVQWQRAQIQKLDYQAQGLTKRINEQNKQLSSCLRDE